MAKLTLDEKITKVTENITKEELSIEESKDRIKKLKVELKTLKAEKEQSFANEILKLMKSKGISHEELITQLKATESQTSETSDETFSSPNVSSDTTSSTENKTEFSTSNDFQRGTNNSL